MVVTTAAAFSPLQHVVALSEEQKATFDMGIYYFDVEVGNNNASCTLLGSNNAEKVWNFFISKGYSPEQTAGILGNMHTESGVEPMRAQGRPAEEKHSSAEVVDGDFPGGPAWGLVQWDPPTKMINPSVEEGKEFSEIDTVEHQASFLWHQLEGTGPTSEKAAGTHLKQQATVEDATESFMKKFERPADQSDSAVAERVKHARSYFIEYSSNTGGAVGCDGTSLTARELAQAILNSGSITMNNSVDRAVLERIAVGEQACPNVDPSHTVDERLLHLIVALGENNTFSISSLHRGCSNSIPVGSSSSSMHNSGKAVDISGASGVNGEVIGSYGAYSSNIQSFIDEAASLLPAVCEIGVPNSTYVGGTTFGACTNIFVDEGSGPHLHFAVDD